MVLPGGVARVLRQFLWCCKALVRPLCRLHNLQIAHFFKRNLGDGSWRCVWYELEEASSKGEEEEAMRALFISPSLVLPYPSLVLPYPSQKHAHCGEGVVVSSGRMEGRAGRGPQRHKSLPYPMCQPNCSVHPSHWNGSWSKLTSDPDAARDPQS